jgi:SAM-dependent methyltransferase
MSEFDPNWLALREPADHAAINHRLRRTLLAHLVGRETIAIVDLGCGTGSNFRSLSPEIAATQRWTLIDHDSALLERAEYLNRAQGNAGIDISYRQADFADGNIADLIDGHDLVTAAALFDLISDDKIALIVDQIAATGTAFYTVLTYDGIAAWLPETPAATALRHAFNRHQRTDKGFGPAAGPDSTRTLARAFEKHGYTTDCAKSPWVLGDEFIELRRETDRGWAAAAAEADGLTVEEGEAWLDSRANDPDAVTIVGHTDLLALPPR